jgi:hypothetical protein
MRREAGKKITKSLGIYPRYIGQTSLVNLYLFLQDANQAGMLLSTVLRVHPYTGGALLD